MKHRPIRVLFVSPLSSGDVVIVLSKGRQGKVIVADPWAYPTSKRVDACLAA